MAHRTLIPSEVVRHFAMPWAFHLGAEECQVKRIAPVKESSAKILGQKRKAM